MGKKHLFFVGLVFVLSASVSAQWNLVGTAVDDGVNCVQLTSSWIPQQSGGAWHDCQIQLAADFDLEFIVNVGSDDGGADGMCFVLHQEGSAGGNLVGVSGGDIGYGGGPFGLTSIAVEIDTYSNVYNNDPWFDHIAINGGGNVNHNLSGAVQADPNNGNIENGQSHTFRVTWDSGSNTLDVHFNGMLRQTLTLDLINDIFNGDPLVNWGWTGTTGGFTNVHSFCLGAASYSTMVDSVSLEATEFCDCLGNTLDVLGVCGGGCPADFNQNGICDDEEIPGCMYQESPNYDPTATMDDGSCLDPNSCDSPCPLVYEGDNDGIVGAGDLLGLLAEFGESCQSAAGD